MFTVQRFLGKVLRLLVNRGLLSPEWGERILSWRHSGVNAHSRVRARTKIEAGRVGKYMVRPVLGLDRLVFLEREGQVGYTEYAVVDRTIRHLKLEFLTPFCSREYHHFVRGGAYFGPHGSEFSDAQKRNFLL